MRTGKVGLVPTMGALHDGHLSLMREARGHCDTLVMSLFVNPTQFGPNEDFSKYPRDEQRDADLARSVGVDVVFAPSPQEMYPRKTTVVSVKEIPDRWEGAFRPGHFDGVATVVCKLFNIVQPDFAVFGRKDLQQCAVLLRMKKDLNLGLEIRIAPTVREEDGLALSSRNVYLSAEERKIAPMIYQQLKRCSGALLEGKPSAEELAVSRQALESVGMEVDYFALVDTEDLSPKADPKPGDSLIVAARVGQTRLIDNIPLGH